MLFLAKTHLNRAVLPGLSDTIDVTVLAVLLFKQSTKALCQQPYYGARVLLWQLQPQLPKLIL